MKDIFTSEIGTERSDYPGVLKSRETLAVEEAPVPHVRLKFTFIIFATLVSCRFFTFQLISDRIYDVLEILVCAVMTGIILVESRQNQFGDARFSNNVGFFMALPLLSAFSAGIFHGQPLILSLLALKTIFIWLLYFVLHIFNIPKRWIINFMIGMGIIWVTITVAQQFTYPTFYFYTRDGEDGSLLRAGVYRFFLEPKNYCLFIILYFYNKFLASQHVKSILLVLFGLIGYYYLGARQYAATALLCMIFLSLMQKGNKRVISILFITAVVTILFLLKDYLFQSYIEMTNEQLKDDEDIRILAAKYYLFDYWPHWLTVFFGNGVFHYDASYGMQNKYLMENLGYYREDIGIIGAFNYFGLFYVINVAHLIIKGLKDKFYTPKTVYLKLFFINSLILIFLSHEFIFPSSIAFFCFVFYLVDHSYYQKKQFQLEGRSF